MPKRIEFINFTTCLLAFFSMVGGCGPDITAQMELAQVHEKDGYFRQAEIIYQKIIKDKPGSSKAMAAQKNLVLLYFRMDNCARAGRALGRLIEDYTEHSGLMDSLHEIIGKYTYGSLRGRPGTAVEAWYVQQQIQHFLNLPDMSRGPLAVRAMNVMILTELQPSEVAAQIDKFITDFSGDPELPRALWYIAEKYAGLKEYEKANNIYWLIKQHSPDSSYAGKAYLDFQKAHILFLIDSEQDAKAQASIDILCTDFRDCPGLQSALDDIAGKYESLKKYDDVVAIYHRMIKIDPHSEFAAIAQQAIGWTYFARGMYDQAIQEYRKVLENYPESVQLAGSRYWIAQSYYEKREYEPAKEEYQRVISMYPESREAIYSEQKIARIYSILKMHEQAISEYRKIVNSYPESGWASDALFRVAQSYDLIGEFEQAIKEYQKVIDTYPASQAAATAEKQIARIKSLKKN